MSRQLRDLLNQLGLAHGFGQEGIHPGLKTGLTVAVIGIGGQRDGQRWLRARLEEEATSSKSKRKAAGSSDDDEGDSDDEEEEEMELSKTGAGIESASWSLGLEMTNEHPPVIGE